MIITNFIEDLMVGIIEIYEVAMPKTFEMLLFWNILFMGILMMILFGVL